VLVRAARHRDDHAVDELVPRFAASLRGEIVRVRRAAIEVEGRFHVTIIAPASNGNMNSAWAPRCVDPLQHTVARVS
jgi:DNA-binding GntR family transcriptional regulator